MFSCSYPNQVPVRPIPVWTQSKTSRTPCSSQRARKSFKYPRGGVITPASPRIGSTITIAVFFDTALRIADISPKGTCLISFSKGLNGARLLSWPVSESAPIVRPWKAPIVATMRVLPDFLESFNAASFASAPELQKNTRAVLSPVSSCNFFASAKPDGWI